MGSPEIADEDEPTGTVQLDETQIRRAVPSREGYPPRLACELFLKNSGYASELSSARCSRTDCSTRDAAFIVVRGDGGSRAPQGCCL